MTKTEKIVFERIVKRLQDDLKVERRRVNYLIKNLVGEVDVSFAEEDEVIESDAEVAASFGDVEATRLRVTDEQLRDGAKAAAKAAMSVMSARGDSFPNLPNQL